MFYKVRKPKISKIRRKRISRLVEGKIFVNDKNKKCCAFCSESVVYRTLCVEQLYESKHKRISPK
jgi:hypothetical protein